ncbi:AraC family transcriptional regulator [Paenibacillus psychroresistens]|uniref:AraC family transcriptional regulator n=1 Tax=Paenibacillus psychroresistens TaxID=1778678 RepID=A0A6B8RQN4_9BACL|nr:AraC family transcriptional regulator [Paenibacillus psychroresistens]QGQ97598.1 AraC family transcriptional regulator [Paenibacillus psychroresistens]
MANHYMEHYINGGLELGFNLHYCGTEQCVPSHSYGPAMRDHYLLHYVVSGTGIFSTTDCEYRLKPGDSFCMFPNRPVSYRADGDDPWTYYWIGFGGENAANLLKLSQITELSPTHAHAEPKRVEALFAELLRVSEDDGLASEASCLGLLLQVFATYLQSQAGTSLPARRHTKGRRDFYISQAIRFIQDNYQKHITVPLIAKQVGLERAYFTKLFHAHVGIAPYEFLLRYRIEKAILLLGQTNLPIQIIANSVGFDNAAYFGKLFTRHIGQSPFAFRKHNQTLL